MGSEHVNAYELGGGTALRGLNWPHKPMRLTTHFWPSSAPEWLKAPQRLRNRSTPEGPK